MFVKSSFPGLLWWDPRTTLASSSLASVSETALIRVSSRIRCVDGSSGTLMSTLRKTRLPFVSMLSSVEKSYVDKLQVFPWCHDLSSYRAFNLSELNGSSGRFGAINPQSLRKECRGRDLHPRCPGKSNSSPESTLA